MEARNKFNILKASEFIKPPGHIANCTSYKFSSSRQLFLNLKHFVLCCFSLFFSFMTKHK